MWQDKLHTVLHHCTTLDTCNNCISVYTLCTQYCREVYRGCKSSHQLIACKSLAYFTCTQQRPGLNKMTYPQQNRTKCLSGTQRKCQLVSCNAVICITNTIIVKLIFINAFSVGLNKPLSCISNIRFRSNSVLYCTCQRFLPLFSRSVAGA